MSSEIKVDTISEKTSANGITIDGVNIKDGQVDSVDVSVLNTTVSALSTGITEYDVWHLQPKLFVIESYEELKQGFRDYAKHLSIL